MGPDNAYLYMGPESSSGYVVYGGNRTHIPMNFFLRPGKREGSLCVLHVSGVYCHANLPGTKFLLRPQIGPDISGARTGRTTNGRSGRIGWRFVF